MIGAIEPTRYRGGVLPRRPYFGLDLAGTPTPGGVRVRAVHQGGPAEEAGLLADDLLVSVDGASASEPADVVRALRRAAMPVRIAFEREGEKRDALLRPTPWPLEAVSEGRVVLGEVHVSGNTLRTILTVPSGSSPFGVMVFLQGLDAGSCERPFEPDHPERRLVSQWAAAGFATLRVDRCGVGDSEGPPPTEAGLDVEIATADAAIEAAASIDGVDASRVFVFGVSLGGMIAPLASRLARARGVIVFGTSAERWRRCAVGTVERQLSLRGHHGEDLAERVALWAEMHAAVCRDGLSPGEAMERRPHLAVLASRACRGDTLFGRSAGFFRALDAADLRAAWGRADRDVLVLRGEHDVVSGERDALSVVEAAGPRARMIELPGVGHDLRKHASLEQSLRAPLAGAWDGQVGEASVAWARSLTLAAR